VAGGGDPGQRDEDVSDDPIRVTSLEASIDRAGTQVERIQPGESKIGCTGPRNHSAFVFGVTAIRRFSHALWNIERRSPTRA
jgi:hypothetical protein